MSSHGCINLFGTASLPMLRMQYFTVLNVQAVNTVCMHKSFCKIRCDLQTLINFRRVTGNAASILLDLLASEKQFNLLTDCQPLTLDFWSTVNVVLEAECNKS
jgi:hypothetical protein